ncbi:hypothetical protein NOC27_2069 [Nitrosococcus oceani AFC27]|nr:hypothetical protein NOC27_2069 [Nitrosococcus oceani AFC27]
MVKSGDTGSKKDAVDSYGSEKGSDVSGVSCGNKSWISV